MRKSYPLPSRETLLALFEYDPDSGEIRNRVNRGRARAGALAGSGRPDGYRRIGINQVTYYVHRLIWMMQTGEDPGDMQIDHRSGDKRDNSWANLRLASHAENQRNGGSYAGSVSPFCGVSWHENTKKWQVQIRRDGRQKHLGVFPCMIEAARAYDEAALKMHGSFAQLNFPDETETGRNTQ